MATAAKALIQMEGAVTPFPMAAMVDSGDGQIFSYTGADVFSMDADFEPEIKPNGIVTGRKLLSPGSAVDEIDVATFTVHVGGTLVTVSADTVTITRPATDVAKICAVCVDASGTLTIEAGTDGASAALSETFGAAGGPPIIPDAKVMIGQWRGAASASAVVDSSELFQGDGVHTERSDFPTWDIKPLGDGDQDALTSAQINAYIKFSSGLPQIHASGSKPVYGKVYEPIQTDVARGNEFVPAEYSYTGTKEGFYGGSTSSTSESLSDASFSALLDNGVTDGVLRRRGKVTTVKFFPDRNKAPYVLVQGTMAAVRSFNRDNQIAAAFTLVCDGPAVDFAS